MAPNCPNLKNSGYFTCGSKDHLARNCPKKAVEGGNANKGSNTGRKLTI